RRLLEAAGDRLDLGVIGGHARAHEPERRRKRVVEGDLETPARQKVLTRVEAARPGADHRHSHGHQSSRIKEMAPSGQVPSASSANAVWSAGTPIASPRTET